MRARIVIGLVIALSAVGMLGAMSADAARIKITVTEHLAQADEGATGSPSPAEGEDEAEGSEQKATEEAATEEAGPPWTYQMARLTVALLLLLAAGVAAAYYRFVVTRQRSGV